VAEPGVLQPPYSHGTHEASKILPQQFSTMNDEEEEKEEEEENARKEEKRRKMSLL